MNPDLTLRRIEFVSPIGSSLTLTLYVAAEMEGVENTTEVALDDVGVMIVFFFVILFSKFH